MAYEEAVPTFVEHLLLASVSGMIEGPIIHDLLNALTRAMSVPGVLATHVGRCIPVLGDHTFIMHIRAVDTAACDASYLKAHEAYRDHIAVHGINTAEDFQNILIVDFECQPIGSWRVKWPALRVVVLKYKDGIPTEKRLSLENIVKVLPARFPLVKQVCFGRNFATQRMYRGNYAYADVDQDLGVLLAFNSCEDMQTLGADPKYWEVLNMYGIAILDKYQVLTYCQDQV